MDRNVIRTVLARLQRGELPLEQGVEELAKLSFEDMGFARIDHQRELRQGFPEVIYAADKTGEQVAAIFAALLKESAGSVMATRVTPAKAAVVHRLLPAVVYDETAGLLYVKRLAQPPDPSRRILVLTAGTGDIPVAAEAALTAELMGQAVDTCHDVGVAGIHRLFAQAAAIRQANVLIVVAGMEGALPSVVSGLTAQPVIAVPTSVGYGASFQGLAALLSMLNSCAAGVAVMNIDNGFGAGVLASRINGMR